jgi:hypothetical protein
MYIIWAPPLPLPHSKQNLSTLLFSDFVDEKTLKDNEKNMAFLLVWDMDSYTRRFFVLFLCICILQPKLVDFYQDSLGLVFQ